MDFILVLNAVATVLVVFVLGLFFGQRLPSAAGGVREHSTNPGSAADPPPSSRSPSPLPTDTPPAEGSVATAASGTTPTSAASAALLLNANHDDLLTPCDQIENRQLTKTSTSPRRGAVNDTSDDGGHKVEEHERSGSASQSSSRNDDHSTPSPSPPLTSISSNNPIARAANPTPPQHLALHTEGRDVLHTVTMDELQSRRQPLNPLNAYSHVVFHCASNAASTSAVVGEDEATSSVATSRAGGSSILPIPTSTSSLLLPEVEALVYKKVQRKNLVSGSLLLALRSGKLYSANAEDRHCTSDILRTPVCQWQQTAAPSAADNQDPQTPPSATAVLLAPLATPAGVASPPLAVTADDVLLRVGNHIAANGEIPCRIDFCRESFKMTLLNGTKAGDILLNPSDEIPLRTATPQPQRSSSSAAASVLSSSHGASSSSSSCSSSGLQSFFPLLMQVEMQQKRGGGKVVTSTS